MKNDIWCEHPKQSCSNVDNVSSNGND